MKYFVTGATGFLGGNLAKKLVEEGHVVNALVRDPVKARPLLDLGVRLFQGDITLKETLYEPMRGVDGVFHVAAWYKVGAKDRSMAESINVDGTRNVLEVMKELKIKKGVYTSTLAVFSDTGGKQVSEDFIFHGKHISEYDRTKWKAHHEVARPMMESGLPLVIVQPGVIYGPGDTSSTGELLDDYLKRDLPIVPKGTKWCWAHVDDIVKGHILAMEKGEEGEEYIISGECSTVEDALEMARDITDVKPPLLKVPPALLKISSALMMPVSSIINLPAMYHPESLRAAAGVTYMGSNEKARRELGYSPRSIKEGFRQYLPKRMEELGISR